MDGEVALHIAEGHIPAGEGVPLTGRLDGFLCRFAPVDGLRAEDGVIVVHESHRVTVDGERTGNKDVMRGHGGRDLAPAAEGIALARRIGKRSDTCAIRNALRFAVGLAVHLISQRITVDAVLRMDGEVALHIAERCIPAGEGVPLAGRLDGFLRRFAPVDSLRAEDGVIVIQESHRVCIEAVLCRDGLVVCRHGRDCRCPAGKGIACFRRCVCVVQRHIDHSAVCQRVVRHFYPFRHVSKPVDVDIVQRVHGQVAHHEGVVFVPTGESVSFTRRVCRSGRSGLQVNGIGFQNSAVVVREINNKGHILQGIERFFRRD